MAATIVQSQVQRYQGVTSGTCALPGAATAGNCIVICASYIDLGQTTSATPATPTDSNGTVSIAIKPNPLVGSGDVCGTMICYVPNCASGAHTITVNPFNHTNQLYVDIWVGEISGLTITPLDKVTSNDQPTAVNTTTWNTGTTSALAQTNEWVIASLAIISGGSVLTNAGISTPATTGYTSAEVDQATNLTVGSEFSYKEANSTSGQIATWTYTSDSVMQATQAAIATFIETNVVATVPFLLGQSLL